MCAGTHMCRQMLIICLCSYKNTATLLYSYTHTYKVKRKRIRSAYTHTHQGSGKCTRNFKHVRTMKTTPTRRRAAQHPPAAATHSPETVPVGSWTAVVGVRVVGVTWGLVFVAATVLAWSHHAITITRLCNRKVQHRVSVPMLMFGCLRNHCTTYCHTILLVRK